MDASFLAIVPVMCGGVYVAILSVSNGCVFFSHYTSHVWRRVKSHKKSVMLASNSHFPTPDSRGGVYISIIRVIYAGVFSA
jgi:hypothetical protein